MIKSIIWVLNHPNNRNSKLKTLLRVVWWKINQICFKLPSIVEIKKGINYIAYPDSSFGGLVVYTKLPEFYEMNFFENLIESNDVVIDVGVHMGDYTLLAASKIRGGRVLAFEPSKEALRGLSQNIAINKFEDNITIYPFVASDKRGVIDFADNDRSEVSHINYSRNDKNVLKVKTVRIDDIVSQKLVKKIKFVKIDVEGAEMLVLRGMQKTLSKKVIKYMIIEINSDSKNYGFTPEDTFKYIMSFGYKLFYFEENGKLKKLTEFPSNKKYINVIAKFN